MKYQKKAKVSSYAEPVARACIMDLAAYCVENPGTTLAISTTYGKNCVDTETPGGSVTIFGTVPTCDATGSLTSGKISAKLVDIDDYTASCTVQAGGFKCTIE
ncbi:MAG: prepilin-type N-terminal cleavage/methylation domain-containing protein [Sulfurihydrogenibium sp.]|uniref:prepilin-type N-terminal cleavage/methylation domain-containing protein n=1 Tax=Sulfurihydrogenibium sp. TaxID=2053621 RepID=UPI003D0F3ADA